MSSTEKAQGLRASGLLVVPWIKTKFLRASQKWSDILQSDMLL